ncbi:MAG: dTDP-4-dehydrorhamnose 3,5-epimerase family protein [Desulfovibrio sp.]|nr:dTDP-4-dehydrorhamnose 3,5-epimerase family protein [Desulfovibrio sp.]
MDSLESVAQQTGIAGVLWQELAVIPTQGGPVLHLLRSEYPLMPFTKGFGEIYFSEVLEDQIKAWKCHRSQTQLFAVPVGLLKVVLFDARQDSPSAGQVQEFLLGRPKHYGLLKIPPRIWYGFTALGGNALLCNCADLPHDPTESERRALDDPFIPYRFPIKPASSPRPDQ